VSASVTAGYAVGPWLPYARASVTLMVGRVGSVISVPSYFRLCSVVALFEMFGKMSSSSSASSF
jgi:hypothetical protein